MPSAEGAGSAMAPGDRPLRILHISDRLWPVGGAERLLHDTAQALQTQGHAVAALVADDAPDGPAVPWPVWRWPRVLGPRPAWRLRPRLDALLADWRPDVVHLHNTSALLSAVLVAHLLRRVPTLRYVHDARLACLRSPSKLLPVDGALCPHALGWRCLQRCYPVVSTDGHRRTDKDLLLALADLWVTRRLPAVAVGSHYMLGLMRQNGVAADRLHLLPGFTGQRPPACPPVPGRLLVVGRFDGIKGLEGLPALLARLQVPHWQAVVAGDGPNRRATEAEAARLGLSERIRFAGVLAPQALAQQMAQAQVLLCPTRVPEAFGLVGIEAYAHGRPVVAYDLGGVADWLQHGGTGALVAAGDAAAFAAAVDALLADPRLAARQGAAGRDLLDARFRPEHHLQPLVGLYHRLAGGAGAATALAPAAHRAGVAP